MLCGRRAACLTYWSVDFASAQTRVYIGVDRAQSCYSICYNLSIYRCIRRECIDACELSRRRDTRRRLYQSKVVSVACVVYPSVRNHTHTHTRSLARLPSLDRSSRLSQSDDIPSADTVSRPLRELLTLAERNHTHSVSSRASQRHRDLQRRS